MQHGRRMHENKSDYRGRGAAAQEKTKSEQGASAAAGYPLLDLRGAHNPDRQHVQQQSVDDTIYHPQPKDSPGEPIRSA